VKRTWELTEIGCQKGGVVLGKSQKIEEAEKRKKKIYKKKIQNKTKKNRKRR
jgi:hypothetical protein